MSLLIVVLILFGSFSHSLSGEKCRFDRIYKEVLKFCKSSDYPGCSNDLNNFPSFLEFFQSRTEFFCHLPRIRDYCKACSLNVNDAGNGSNSAGNESTATGNGTNSAGNDTNTTGNGTATTP